MTVAGSWRGQLQLPLLLALVAAVQCANIVAGKVKAASAGGGECSASEFRCNNSRCILSHWRCDGANDCEDNSDEDPVQCAEMRCPRDHYMCPIVHSVVHCIPLSWLCDGHVDCGQTVQSRHTPGNDEFNCSRKCPESQFMCATDGQCIPRDWLCDGRPDCMDSSDEHNCTSVACDADTHFKCASGECVSISMKCDGDRDCNDGSDEQNCMETASVSAALCQPPKVACGDQLTCIFASWVCDGDIDCTDGSDESPDRCVRQPCASESDHQCGGIGECVAKEAMCNGVADCRDASDETNCANITSVPLSAKLTRLCDPLTEFTCESHSSAHSTTSSSSSSSSSGERAAYSRACVPLKTVCNGQQDCADGSDESGRCAECSVNNGGCSHQCIALPAGRQCRCPLGYQLTDDQLTCVDTDECLRVGMCSHKCINLKGTFKCDCYPGYTLDPVDARFCKADDNSASLLLTHRSDLRQVMLNQGRVVSLVNGTNMAASVDYHYSDRLVFWADVIDRAIYRTSIASSSPSSWTKIVTGVSCEGLAVDWVYRHLYLIRVAQSHSAIEVTDLDGHMSAPVITSNLQKPRAISLDPANGWMYWTDWGAEPRIERAGMDGSRRQPVVTSRLAWPNGLTLDLLSGRLYWTDAKLQLVESVLPDGSGRRLLISSRQLLHHPFSISVFEDSLYWTDWDRLSVFSANKFTGAGVTSVASQGQVHFPVEVRVYHPYRQPATVNHCESFNGGCSHICLPAPRVSPTDAASAGARLVTCACPFGFRMTTDGRRCQLTQAPNKTSHAQTKLAAVSALAGRVQSGSLVGVIFGSVVLFIVVVSVLGLLVYRYCDGGTGGLGFTNAIYKKTTVSALKLDRARAPFSSRAHEESLMPLTRSQEETA